MLRQQALAVWRFWGQQWKVWSSRCVSAGLQVYKRPSSRIYLVSCYAPTRTASRENKAAFFQELERIISSVPSGERYVILGDFNTCVGSRESIDGEWSNTCSSHSPLHLSNLLYILDPELLQLHCSDFGCCHVCL